MSNYAMSVKAKLLRSIECISDRKSDFVTNPRVDFTRERKLSFRTMIKFILSMGGGSLTSELLDYFKYNPDTASAPAFVQRRNKILPKAFHTLLSEFTSSFSDYKTYEGYRIVAVDGSDLHTFHDPTNTETFHQMIKDGKGRNFVHVNAMYDLLNKVFLDACIQPKKYRNEPSALVNLVKETALPQNMLLIADRGYESFNVFAHIEAKRWKYLIRVKDVLSNGMLSTFNLPDTGEFDMSIQRILTRKNTQHIKENSNKYKVIYNSTAFDFLDDTTLFYPLDFRVVRIDIGNGKYHSFITNLDSECFPIATIADLYHMRWGIETSFRDLKHTLGLTHIHTKKVEHTIQEIYSKMIMYNFCSIITSHVVLEQKQRKHSYQINFSKAIYICYHFFKSHVSVRPPDVEALIQKYILPIRKGRQYPRRTRSRTFVSFNYRIV